MSQILNQNAIKTLVQNYQSIINIILTQLKLISLNGLIKTNFFRFNNLNLFEILQTEPLPVLSLRYIDYHWRFQISNQQLKMTISPSIMRTHSKLLSSQSQRANIQINRILKVINQNRLFSNSYLHLNKDNTFSLTTVIKWNQHNPHDGSFRFIFLKLIKQTKQVFNKIIPLIIHYFSVEKTIINQTKKQIKSNEQMNILYQQLQQLKNTFEQHRKSQPNSSILSNFDKQLNFQNGAVPLSYYLIFLKQLNKLNQNKQLFPLKFSRLNVSNQVKNIKNFPSYKLIHQKQTVNQQNLIGDSSNIIAIQVIKKARKLEKVSTNGQHSQITKGIYHIKLLLSINQNFFVKQIDSYNFINLQFQQARLNNNFKKQLVKKRCYQSQASINSFINQIKFLVFIRNRKCPSIATYYCPSIKNLTATRQIFIEVYPTTLKQKIKQKQLTTFMKLVILYKIVQGAMFLLEQGVLHRDLKPGNVLISNCSKMTNSQQILENIYSPKIIDFGSCCPVYGKEENFSVYDMRLLSTEKYYKEYKDVDVKQIKLNYTKQEYNRHPLFDMFGIGQIIIDLFDFDSQLYQIDDGNKILDYLYYLSQRCKEINPDDRLSHQELLIFLDKIIKCYIHQVNKLIDNKNDNNNIQDESRSISDRSLDEIMQNFNEYIFNENCKKSVEKDKTKQMEEKLKQKTKEVLSSYLSQKSQ